MAFGVVLLVLPALSVGSGQQTLAKVTGLLISGVGFLLFGGGFAFSHLGLSVAILPGMALTAVGYTWQRRAAQNAD